jgi:hypothetical protein
MAAKKGNVRKGAKMVGSRLAYEDTKDSRRKPSAAAKRAKGTTTKKGMARKGTAAGSRLAFDATKQEKKKKTKKDSPFDDLKEGAFTRQARSHGYSDTMGFARLIMRLNKQDKHTLPSGKKITPLLVKRANFAVNFGGKKKT